MSVYRPLAANTFRRFNTKSWTIWFSLSNFKAKTGTSDKQNFIQSTYLQQSPPIRIPETAPELNRFFLGLFPIRQPRLAQIHPVSSCIIQLTNTTHHKLTGSLCTGPAVGRRVMGCYNCSSYSDLLFHVLWSQLSKNRANDLRISGSTVGINGVTPNNRTLHVWQHKKLIFEDQSLEIQEPSHTVTLIYWGGQKKGIHLNKRQLHSLTHSLSHSHTLRLAEHNHCQVLYSQ